MKEDNQEELQDRAWGLVQEALTRGTVTLETGDPAKPSIRMLATEDVIDLAKFFVQLKVKKPQAITPPEDYILPVTTDSE